MFIQSAQSQKGFLSAFVVIFVVTLGMLAVGSAMLVRSEATNMGNQVAMIKSENAVRGGVHFARKYIAVNEDYSVIPSPPMLGASVSFDVQDVGNLINLYVDVSSGPVSNSLLVQLQGAGGSLNYAIFASGSVNDQTTLDSTGAEDNSLIYQNAPSFPTVLELTLDTVATFLDTLDSVGRKHAGATFQPVNGYPTGAFYHASGLPNVTIVDGDLIIDEDVTVFGIFVVGGDVTFNTPGWFSNGGRVNGVIYMKTAGEPCELKRDSRVRGAIYTKGTVTGYAGWGSDSEVRHDPVWVRTFLEYVDQGDEAPVPAVLSWDYL